MESPSPVVSENEHDGQQPTRMSALYQYHNAPEVAPAHGLEYDDTIYPVSDKFPVVREIPFLKPHHYTGKHAMENDNRPPRIIFGMKVKTFLVVATVMVLVVVGAAVGGAVGGKHLHQGTPQGVNFGNYPGGTMSSTATSSQQTKTTASPTTPATTFHAPTPTYKPISDCPQSNFTVYKSPFGSDSESTFVVYCDLANPLSQNADVSFSKYVAESFVYSMSDCVNSCASYNSIQGGGNCTVAVYKPQAKRPSNCLIGYAFNVTASQLGEESGTEVALLESQSS